MKLLNIQETRWTFFRVKLVFECEFEIYWSFGPLDLGTLGPWDSWTSSLLQHLLILPLTTSYILISLPPLVWFGYGGGVVTLEDEIGEGPLIDLKKLRGPPPSFYILSLSPPTSFLFLPATPPSSQTSSQVLLPPPEGSQMTNQFIQDEISMLFCSEKFYGWVETLQLKLQAAGPGLLEIWDKPWTRTRAWQ